jgi:hypothetical protein
MILDCVVGSARHHLRNLSPFVTKSGMGIHNDLVFKSCPLLFLYVRVQVVVPTFPTLLSYSARQVVSDSRPVSSAPLNNQF